MAKSYSTIARSWRAQCHSVDAAEKDAKVGQPLFAVGDKLGRTDLVDSILHPSASIAVGYSTTTVRTKGGDVVEGILRESTPTAIALMQGDGKLGASRQRTSPASRPATNRLCPRDCKAG